MGNGQREEGEEHKRVSRLTESNWDRSMMSPSNETRRFVAWVEREIIMRDMGLHNQWIWARDYRRSYCRSEMLEARMEVTHPSAALRWASAQRY